MERRNFIRLLGGGMAIAGGAGLAACSGDYPATAVAAWSGPADTADLRHWALGHAILAPSSHNRQPWIVDLNTPDALTLYVDRERTLPMTDPWFRQIVVSQGTFIEALVLALAARGAEPRVALFPQGEFAPRALDARPVAHIAWRAPVSPAAPSPDTLFAQLKKRQTAKVEYDTARPVAPALLDALKTSQVDPGVQFGATVDPARVDVLRTLCRDSAHVELLTPRTVMESLRLTRIGPTEIDRYRDGISVNALVPRVAAALGQFDRSRPPVEGSVGFRQMMERFDGHSRTAMGFVWLSTPTRPQATRSAQVAAGRAYLRLQLKATELGLQMHPMSQAPQEFVEMQAHYDRLHSLLLGRPASTETVQMFCRIGHCADQPHTPRRGVDAIVRA